jgi:hypothetical protein
MGARWEESELRVPLNMKAPPLTRAAIAQRANETIRAAVLRAGDDGWEPGHPYGFDALDSSGRVQRRVSRGFLGLGQETTTYIAARVLLRRIKIE